MNIHFTKSCTIKHFTYPYFSNISATTMLTRSRCARSFISPVIAYFARIFSPPGFCSRILLTSLTTGKNIMVTVTGKCNVYNIKRNVLKKTSPLWLVKNCHQYEDFWGTSQRRYQCAVFLGTSEKHYCPMRVMIVTRCLCMRTGWESLKRAKRSSF